MFQSFKVLVQESGERRFLAIGVVRGPHYSHAHPGWLGGSVGYHIDDGRIFEEKNSQFGREVKGLKSSVHSSNSTHAIHCSVEPIPIPSDYRKTYFILIG